MVILSGNSYLKWSVIPTGTLITFKFSGNAASLISHHKYKEKGAVCNNLGHFLKKSDWYYNSIQHTRPVLRKAS